MMPQPGDRVCITLYNEDPEHELCGPATVQCVEKYGFWFHPDAFGGGDEGFCNAEDAWHPLPLTDAAVVTTLQTMRAADAHLKKGDTGAIVEDHDCLGDDRIGMSFKVVSAEPDSNGCIKVVFGGGRNPFYLRDSFVRVDQRNAAPVPAAAAAPNADEIAAECDALKQLLLRKNEAYGDSALNPLRIFSRAGTVEGICVRIDDKLSRIARGDDAGEDTVQDLIGYLIMLRIAQRKAKGQ